MGQTRCCLIVFIFFAGLKFRSCRSRHISAEMNSYKRTENVRNAKTESRLDLSWFYIWDWWTPVPASVTKSDH